MTVPGEQGAEQHFLGQELEAVVDVLYSEDLVGQDFGQLVYGCRVAARPIDPMWSIHLRKETPLRRSEVEEMLGSVEVEERDLILTALDRFALERDHNLSDTDGIKIFERRKR